MIETADLRHGILVPGARQDTRVSTWSIMIEGYFGHLAARTTRGVSETPLGQMKRSADARITDWS